MICIDLDRNIRKKRQEDCLSRMMRKGSLVIQIIVL